MKILIDDGMQINRGTGIGKYTFYLFKHLKNKENVDLSVDLEQFDKENSSQISGRLKYIKHINSWKYRCKCEKYDIVHYTNYFMPFIREKRVKYIVTVHDMVSFIHPETLPKIYCIYSRFSIKYSMKYADVILTDSESVKSEIEKFFPKYSSKVYTAYPGLYNEYCDNKISSNYENKELKQKLSDNTNFFLFIGTIEKRKNVGTIIDGFIKIKQLNQSGNLKLVLAGRAGYGYDDFVKKAETAGIINDVIFSGYTSLKDCKRLYRNALAYIFPTVYEGFGSTQLECMANETPIILSDIPTNREVSDGYGLFFDLNDLETLVAQMNRIVRGEYSKKNMSKIAQDKLDKYSWDKLINDYIKIYKMQ